MAMNEGGQASPKQVTETLTNECRSSVHSSEFSSGLQRRGFLATAAAITMTAVTRADDFGPHAQPVRYPDHRLIGLDERGKKLMLGNTPIQRLYHSPDMLWAEGPAWNAVGRYLLWSDIPNNVQMRWLEEDGHVSVFRNPAYNSNGKHVRLSGSSDFV